MRYRRLLLLALLATAFFLRIYALDSQSLRGDEAATVHYSAMPIAELWELSRITDPHPPLYYLMLHPWQQLFGEGAWAMRFAGVVGSVLAVAALYTLARRTLRAAPVSLLAAGLLAFNPLQIWLAQDIRSYAFFTLFGLLSAGSLWVALHGDHKSRPSRSRSWGPKGPSHPLFPWFVYIVFTFACFYIHYYTIFLIAFEGLFVLLNAKRYWRHKWIWLVSQALIGLAILPGLGLAANFVGQAAGGIGVIPAPELLRRAATALLTGFTVGDQWGVWISLMLAPIWLAGLLSLLRRDRVSGSFWALFFLAPVLGVIGLSLDRPFFKERFLIQAQPAFEVLLAAGFLGLVRNVRIIGTPRQQTGAGRHDPGTSAQPHLSRFTFQFLRWLPLFLLLFLLLSNFLALSNYFTNPTYAKATPWHLYHEYVSDHARPGDVMLTNFPEAAVSYYSPNELPFYVAPAERDRSVEFRLDQVRDIAGQYQRIWFLPLMHQGFDQEGEVLKWLDRHADRVNQVFFPSYNLNLYLAPPAIEELLIPQPTAFAHGLHLRGFQILDEEGDSRLVAADSTASDRAEDLLSTISGGKTTGDFVLHARPGDEITLSLYWTAGGPTDVPYTVFTHLAAPDGFTRSGWDNQPVWGSYPTTQWQAGEKITDKYTLTIPEGTPPGDNYLRVGWYQSDSQERVSRLDAAGQPVDDQVNLGVIVRVE